MPLSSSPLSTTPLSAQSASVTVVLTGTITASINEGDIVTGGKTIILTVTGGTWVASGATFNAIRQDIINGLNSSGSEAHGWTNEVRANQGVAGVVRTSATVVTITLDAEAAYDITANETITATVPASALVLGNAVIASPTFTVYTTAVSGVAAAWVQAVNGVMQFGMRCN